MTTMSVIQKDYRMYQYDYYLPWNVLSSDLCSYGYYSFGYDMNAILIVKKADLLTRSLDAYSSFRARQFLKTKEICLKHKTLQNLCLSQQSQFLLSNPLKTNPSHGSSLDKDQMQLSQKPLLEKQSYLLFEATYKLVVFLLGLILSKNELRAFLGLLCQFCFLLLPYFSLISVLFIYLRS